MSVPQRYPLQLLEPPDNGALLPDSDGISLVETSGSRIVLKNTLIAVLRGQVDEGVRALPRVGAEVGGLLLGPRGEKNGRILVDEAIPIATEYRFGPSYHLSLPDLARLAEAVAAVENNPSRAIVGFYRSKTRSEQGLRTVDLELLQTLEQMYSSFAAAFRVFVVLTPEDRLDLSAGVHLRTGKKWSAIPTIRLTDRNRARVGSMVEPPNRQPKEQVAAPPAPERAAPQVESIAPAPPAARPVAEDAASESEPRRANRRIWWYAATVAVVAAGTFVAGLWLNRQPQATTEIPHVAPTAGVAMGLSATREGVNWKLSWNAQAISALMPATGVLTARAEASVVQLPLTAQDLAGGTVLSSAHGSDILFILSINAPGKNSVEERVHVLDPNAIAPEKPLPVRTSSPPRDAPPGAASPRIRFTPPEVAVQDRAAPVATLPAPEVVPAPPVTRELPPAAANAPAIGLPVPLAHQSGAADVPAPKVTTPAGEPARKAPATPAQAAASPASYQPPKAIRQVNATKPPLPVLAGPLEIRVHVEIDARGKVTKAVAVNRSATNSRFADSALVAAKFFQFEPARENGRAVPGEAILVFRFAP